MDWGSGASPQAHQAPGSWQRGRGPACRPGAKPCLSKRASISHPLPVALGAQGTQQRRPLRAGEPRPGSCPRLALPSSGTGTFLFSLSLTVSDPLWEGVWYTEVFKLQFHIPQSHRWGRRISFTEGRMPWMGSLCSGGSLGQRSPTFWYEGPISWKTVCPWTGGEGDGLGVIQACYIYCALYF